MHAIAENPDPPDSVPSGSASHDPDPLESAILWRAAGLQVALATVIETWGSAPRPVGSQMAITANGAMVGSVSAGCVEGAVVEEARRTMADGEQRLLSFGVSNEQAWSVGLTCGGHLRIYVECIV